MADDVVPDDGAGGDPASLKANPFAFPNPGAVFDDIDEAARHSLGIINPVSKARNVEHDWQFYRDPHTGKIGYTDPIENGLRGGRVNFPPLQSGMMDMGMAHTHGDYTDVNGMRSTRDNDANDSDNFSGYTSPGQTPSTDPQSDMRAMQMQTMQAMQAGHPTWTYYLGTPSGRFLKWQHGGRVENFE